MQITLNVPDDVARQVAPEGTDPSRIALEALALEGYQSRALSESAVRKMLGFESRLDVHAFLKQHGVHLQYGIAELEQDEAAFRTVHQEIIDSMASRASRRK